MTPMNRDMPRADDTAPAVTALYNREILALAVSLSRWPLEGDLPLRSEQRSASCGSTVSIGLARDDDGRIARLGLKVNACALGQAGAALFAAHAKGRNRPDIARAAEQLQAWLAGHAAPLPDWPGLEALAAARDYPARHSSILLAWKAASGALDSERT